MDLVLSISEVGFTTIVYCQLINQVSIGILYCQLVR